MHPHAPRARPPTRLCFLPFKVHRSWLGAPMTTLLVAAAPPAPCRPSLCLSEAGAPRPLHRHQCNKQGRACLHLDHHGTQACCERQAARCSPHACLEELGPPGPHSWGVLPVSPEGASPPAVNTG